MKQFTVTVDVTKTYTVTIEAEDEHGAKRGGELMQSTQVDSLGSLKNVETAVTAVEEQ